MLERTRLRLRIELTRQNARNSALRQQLVQAKQMHQGDRASHLDPDKVSLAIILAMQA
jgi:hypothetical protein